ncbi:hypothetical protein TNCV_2581371 [Trichonephila clavipes]|nr:hypothetical protein TNCV_2581371 [Trichonephila clavipes]
MLAGYSPQPFLLYYSDMGWRLASRAICPDIVTVVRSHRRRLISGAVFLDIQKALARVWIGGLIYKLITNNFPPALIHLINSYLTNRSYQVRVKDSLSNTYKIQTGGPTRSLLGQSYLIFILMIFRHTHTQV